MMKIYDLSEVPEEEIFHRQEASDDVSAPVAEILRAVQERGDEALFSYARKFDGAELSNLEVTPEEIAVCIVAQLTCCRRLGSDQPERHRQVVNRSDFDQEVLDELAKEDRGPMAMATILSSQGSVPRGAGAKMLITPWGSTVGSIGGGCAEAGVIREALDLIGTGGWKIYEVDLTGSAEDEGMVCGGVMEVLIEDASL